MAFSTEELIQIGLIVGIIIVFGYLAFNYLKTKGMLERKEKPKKEEMKSMSFAKNRKMRGLEKLIPDKKLSKKPSFTEIKIGSTEGLWEPEEEQPFLEKKIGQKTETKQETKSEIKKQEVKELQQIVKKAGEEKKSIFDQLKQKIKGKEKPKEKITEMKFKGTKPETKTAKRKFAFKSGTETAKRKIAPEAIPEKKPTVKLQPKPEEEKVILERIPIDKLKNFVSKGRFAFKKAEETKEPTAKSAEEKPKKDIGKKLEEKIKQYEERMKAVKEGKTKDEVFFDSEEEKQKHEEKFVQKILDSEEGELEKISKAIEPKTGKKWEQEKKETIDALKKEFSELDKKEKKDLWAEPKEKPVAKPLPKPEPKPIIKPTQPVKPIKEFVSNGKFAFSSEKKVKSVKPELTKTETKSSIQEEMKKLIEERKKQMKQKKPAEEPAAKEVAKAAPKIQPKPKTAEKPQPKIESKPAPKPKIEVKKEKTAEKKKKGLFERFGLKKEKINLTREETDQMEKIMIVLKGKTAEYSREDMREAMQNLGYKEKIIEEAMRRLYE